MYYLVNLEIVPLLPDNSSVLLGTEKAKKKRVEWGMSMKKEGHSELGE